MELFFSKEYICDRLKRTVYLYNQNILIGELSIEGVYGPNNDCFDSGNTCYLSISILEEYQSKGFSNLLWKEMLKNLKNIRLDQMFFIDVDASNGYWNHLGMTTNRYDYNTNRNLEGKGYEKVITYQQLLQKFQ
jgi:hypothetical protein